MQAYCVKCRAKREMSDARAITMKNGRPATQGKCPTCGTNRNLLECACGRESVDPRLAPLLDLKSRPPE